LKKLLLANRNSKIEDLYYTDVISVREEADREEDSLIVKG